MPRRRWGVFCVVLAALLVGAMFALYHRGVSRRHAATADLEQRVAALTLRQQTVRDQLRDALARCATTEGRLLDAEPHDDAPVDPQRHPALAAELERDRKEAADLAAESEQVAALLQRATADAQTARDATWIRFVW